MNKKSVLFDRSIWKLMVVLYATSFLLHFVWEMWQVPFYVDMVDAIHWSAILRCSQATFGDGVIALLAYLAAAGIQKSWFWLNTPRFYTYAVYMAVGVLITVVLEFVAVDMMGRWQYSDLMPRLPIIGTGITPLLQWLIIPPAVLWITKTFLKGLIANHE